jgi:hypothetical protein
MKRHANKVFLSITRISHGALLHTGFNFLGHDYHMGNLIIFGGDGFYYFDLNAKRVNLSNMQQVSNLVYGHTPFLDMTNG